MHDFHTHFIPEEVSQWLEEQKDAVKADWRKTDANKTFLTVNGKWGFELKDSFTNYERYQEDQKQAGVTYPVISPVPQLFLYELPTEITRELVSVYNQSLAQLVQSDNKLSAFATVSLSSPELAAEQLRSAMNNGLIGAIIGPNANGRMLTDPYFTPFFEEADRLGSILFIHPLLCEDPRLKKRKMPNLIGVPWETTVCAADILLSGMLDKYLNIKFLLAHGGGFLPYQIGRLNKGFSQWPEVSSVLQASPEEYLKRFWYDSVLWHPQALDFLIKTVGENQVVPGSDFPFDLCVWPPEKKANKGSSYLIGHDQERKNIEIK
ncbi:amidohydrolase family protein [Domibacillus epiphyticus]|uniref:Amidohydrolase n=1 Tax=Domibacillus epiphyticus TaxID=1714355 RepID=A0A1V2A897_9BACI|nr:amidohydrolase family protein [Domibacillus epiphyticus]OMP67218.1 amidohydrolase [Domibacillus epiphyticus]